MLKSAWPETGVPVTFRFRLAPGDPRGRVDFFVGDAAAQKRIGRGLATRAGEGVLESKGRLPAGSYVLAVNSGRKESPQPFVVKPDDPAPVFEFALERP